MPDNKQVKSLVTTCQDTLAKYLDLLVDVGSVPYSLLKASILHATPQQLYRIERANPDIAAESDELWLKHCLLFQDIRQEYEQGLHRDPKQWRELYLNKYQENEKKRQLIKEKVKNQYSKIQNEKEKKSIKVLHGVVPTKKRHSYESARRSTMSKLFQQTKKETDKVASIYHSSPKRPKPMPQNTTTIRVPKPASQRTREYQDNYAMHSRASFSPPAPPPLIQPKSKPLPQISHEPSPKRLKSNNTIDEKKKPVAMVNFNIFNELS